MAKKEKSVQDVINTMNDEQKMALSIIVNGLLDEIKELKGKQKGDK